LYRGRSSTSICPPFVSWSFNKLFKLVLSITRSGKAMEASQIGTCSLTAPGLPIQSSRYRFKSPFTFRGLKKFTRLLRFQESRSWTSNRKKGKNPKKIWAWEKDSWQDGRYSIRIGTTSNLTPCCRRWFPT
jgi:hypothetical protein